MVIRHVNLDVILHKICKMLHDMLTYRYLKFYFFIYIKYFEKKILKTCLFTPLVNQILY